MTLNRTLRKTFGDARLPSPSRFHGPSNKGAFPFPMVPVVDTLNVILLGCGLSPTKDLKPKKGQAMW